MANVIVVMNTFNKFGIKCIGFLLLVKLKN